MAGIRHFETLANPGRPVQLATVDPTNSSKFNWDLKLIEAIFTDEVVANLPVRWILS